MYMHMFLSLFYHLVFNVHSYMWNIFFRTVVSAVTTLYEGVVLIFRSWYYWGYCTCTWYQQTTLVHLKEEKPNISTEGIKM